MGSPEVGPDEAPAVGARADGDPGARGRAPVTVYRRLAIDKPRRYRLMFSLEYESERRPAADHPIETVLQAWTETADAYLAEEAPDRQEEARDQGIHLWTALHGQLVLWRTLPSPVAGSE